MSCLEEDEEVYTHHPDPPKWMFRWMMETEGVLFEASSSGHDDVCLLCPEDAPHLSSFVSGHYDHYERRHKAELAMSLLSHGGIR